MFVGTHAFLPVLAASAVNAHRVKSGRRSLFTIKELVLIGIAGCLPDLLSPHISLSARLSSWTHNVWFLLFSFPLVLGFAWVVSRKHPLILGTFLSAAMALHLLVDLGSGGITPLYPFGSVHGFRTVPFRYWLHVDVIVVSSTVLSVFWTRKAMKSNLPK